MPPRGPRRVLCVVEVTTCACGSGFGYTPAATKAGDVSHVDEQVGADLVGDGAEARPVDLLRIGRKARHDHLRLVFQRQLFDFVVVDQALVVHAVLDGVEDLARGVHLGAVGQVAAMGQRHAQDGVARLQQGEVHGLIGLRARMRLDVGVGGAEQLLDPVDRQLLGDVDVFAAAVVALVRVTLGVLVGQHAAPGLQDARAGVVLAGDQLDVVLPWRASLAMAWPVQGHNLRYGRRAGTSGAPVGAARGTGPPIVAFQASPDPVRTGRPTHRARPAPATAEGRGLSPPGKWAARPRGDLKRGSGARALRRMA